jgi:hypothetical protein
MSEGRKRRGIVMQNNNIRIAAMILIGCVLPAWCAEAPKPSTSGPIVRFSPDPMDFGQVSPGNYKLITLTVTNTGSSDLIIQSDKVYPHNATFALEIGGDGCAGTTVKPGASCNVGLYYEPTNPAYRDVGAYFVIYDNAAGGYQKVLMYGWDEPKTGADEK